MIFSNLSAQNKVILILTGLVILIPINRLIFSSLKEPSGTLPQEKRKENVPGVSTKTESPALQNISRSSMTNAENPNNYGIIAQAKANKPRNAAEWDAFTKKTLLPSKTLDHMEDKKAFEGMKMSSKEYESKVQDINNRIKLLEDSKSKDPGNAELQKKLESLYAMRSTLITLKDKVIEKPKAR